jgi:hypothetical protein
LDDQTGVTFAYYGDPAEYIPDAVWEFYRKYRYNKNGRSFEDECARYVIAMANFEREMEKCQTMSP